MITRAAGILCIGAALGAAPLLSQNQEIEPNDTPATATGAVLGGRVAGAIGPVGHADPGYDVDYWVLEARAGDTIFVKVEASELATGLEPDVVLYAADGVTRLAANDDWDGMDSYLAYIATMTGKYFVAIRHDLPNEGTLRYTINFTAAKCPTTSEGEPNDSIPDAHRVTVGSTIQGVACPFGDRDFFSFAAEKGTTLELQLDTVGRARPSLGCACEIEAWIVLYGPDGLQLARTDQGFPKRFRYDVTTTGTYYAFVGLWPGGIRYPYTLHIRSIGPPSADVSVEAAVGDLLKPGALTAEQRMQLDQRGNGNGRYDVGDLRALLVRAAVLAALMPR